MVSFSEFEKQIEHEINMLNTTKRVFKSLLESETTVEVTLPDIESVERSDLGPFEGAKNVVYVLSSPIASSLDFDTVKALFLERKALHLREFKNNYYHISKINKSNFSLPSNEVLYVGSKRSGFSGRLVQHIGMVAPGNRGVSSLYMRDWCPKSTSLKVSALVFSDSVNIEQLQVIEDVLWRVCRPLFGKKGGNNSTV